MRLNTIKIRNFRKLNDVEVKFGETTFLIGANNSGKSSTLDAIEYLVADKKLDASCRSKYIDDEGNEAICSGDVIIEGIFDNVEADIVNQRGFNASRLNSYTDEDGNTKYSFNYRVRLSEDNKCHREMLMHTQVLKPEFCECRTWQDFINNGASADLFAGIDNLNRALSTKDKTGLEENYPSLFSIEDSKDWFENPGGILVMCCHNCLVF